MALARIHSRAQTGMQATAVLVEVDLANGLPCFSIVGLPEAAVRESKERVRAAIKNSQFEFPNRRITVNLAPAELPKEGGRFDLPIALGILFASEQIHCAHIQQYEFIAELGLGGELRKTRGVLPSALACLKDKRTLITASDNRAELELLKGQETFCADHLIQICSHLIGQQLLSPVQAKVFHDDSKQSHSLAAVRGQEQAKRALTLAAAGEHHLLMIGSPGSGKTLLANHLPALLPAMTTEQAIEVLSIYSMAQSSTALPTELMKRPFRNPHHSVSANGLAGGGSQPKPGEISLAHHGVLFLDELTEFDRSCLEVMREPLESGRITISRAAAQLEFPARFQLIAAMNPCPNGCDINRYGQCQCSQQQIQRYQGKLSAPLLDRIDLVVSVPRVNLSKTPLSTTLDDGDARYQRICQARQRQLQRQGESNARVSGQVIEALCEMNTESAQCATDISELHRLSGRGFHRLLRVARTIADMADVKAVSAQHLLEASSYRQLFKRHNAVRADSRE
jgi:magnesium chelatase family protein|tara:strand:+ start:29262 stop:30794 length:1533 start_codon:yes stop_codon:yes gene_type:complete